MAQLVLAAAGAAIGSIVPGVGTALGWSIGSMLGGALVGSPTQKIQGEQQQLMDLRITGSEYGQAIPFLLGSAAIAGQMWWNTDRRPTTTTTTTSSGGKGGGGGTEVTNSTISYDMDCLIGLTDNEIIGIARIWMNGELIWTAASDATESSLAASAVSSKWTRLTVYTGAADQLPDPTYEAAVGLGNAPAYRGRGSVFIEGLKLGQGGQVPNLTFEVVAAGTMYGAGFATFDTSKGTNGEANFRYGYDIPPPWAKPNSNLYVNGPWVTYAWGSAAPDLFKSSGKYYCEFALMDNPGGLGICNENWRPNDWPAASSHILGENANSYGFYPVWNSGYYQGAWKQHDGVQAHYSNITYLQGCRASLLLDLDAGTLGLWINGVDAGIAFTGITGSWGPAGMVQQWKYGSGCTIITDPLHFMYAPPSGYLPWTRSDPTILKVAPSVKTAVETLCARAGLAANQIDATALSTITRKAKSLAISQIAPTRPTLELLMSAFFFEMVVSDKIYFRPRGVASVADIPYTDLGASGGDGEAEPLPLLQANELEIPAQIALTYINILDDYQTDTQYSDRLISAASGTLNTVQMALGMDPGEAKAIADTMLADQAASVVSTTIKLLGDYCRLEPTDVVTVAGVNGESFRLRLVKKTDSYPVLDFEAVVDSASVLVSPGVTSVEYISSAEVLFPPVTLMELMDIPILAEADNDAGFYAVAKGDTAAWPGAAIFQSVDDVEYVRKATIPLSAVFGTCTTTLGAWNGGRMFDEQNSVTVDVGLGQLQSTTRAALLNSQAINAMMIGAEFIQYRTATLISSGVYKLTGLLRGGRGTEWAMAGHAASERCIALSANGMRRIAMTNSEIGLVRFYKGVTLGGALSSATAEAFTDTAVGLKPFSPFDLRAKRDASNNIAFTWQRRTRFDVRIIGTLGISVPLGEEVEAYALDIYADGTYGTVVRTIGAAVGAAVYTAAEQAADGLTPGDAVHYRLYQISASVGRGYPLERAA